MNIKIESTAFCLIFIIIKLVTTQIIECDV